MHRSRLDRLLKRIDYEKNKTRYERNPSAAKEILLALYKAVHLHKSTIGLRAAREFREEMADLVAVAAADELYTVSRRTGSANPFRASADMPTSSPQIWQELRVGCEEDLPLAWRFVTGFIQPYVPPHQRKADSSDASMDEAEAEGSEAFQVATAQQGEPVVQDVGLEDPQWVDEDDGEMESNGAMTKVTEVESNSAIHSHSKDFPQPVPALTTTSHPCEK